MLGLSEIDLGSVELFLVDLREPQAFARRHVRGSINLQWGFGQFEERVGRLFPSGARLVIYGGDAEQVSAAVTAAQAAGFSSARGFLADPADMDDSNPLLASQPTLAVRDLQKRLQEDELLVLDVRTSAEYAEGHIAGAVFVYPDDIGRVAPALRQDHPVAVICEAGWRSSMVVSWLTRQGKAQVFNVIGGMSEWERQELPTEKGSDQVSFRR